MWWIDYCGVVYISFVYGTKDRHNIAYPVTQFSDSGILALDVFTDFIEGRRRPRFRRRRVEISSVFDLRRRVRLCCCFTSMRCCSLLANDREPSPEPSVDGLNSADGKRSERASILDGDIGLSASPARTATSRLHEAT